MLSVDQAVQNILSAFHTLPAESVPVAEALHRVLAVDVRAAHALPPFANSSMDGYAVRSVDVQSASRAAPIRLAVIEDIPAGTFPTRTVGSGEASRIMTGAPLPPGADAVVPVEQTDDPPGKFTAGSAAPSGVTIFEAARPGANVRPIGEDVQSGQVVLRAGRRLRAADLGVLAGLGQPMVQVVRRPLVAILSTGDELLEIHEPFAPGKIHDANSYTVAALAESLGAQPLRLGIARDTLDDALSFLDRAVVARADLILSSAGVSVGAYDVVKTAIQQLGALDFWKVNMRPGKPLAFGQVRGIPFLGLPGNPVSAMVTFDVFVRPAILRMLGLPDSAPMVEAELAEPLTSDGRRTYARVTLERRDGRLLARSTGSQSSGVLMSLVQADGLLIIPEGVTDVPIGARLPVRLFTEAL